MRWSLLSTIFCLYFYLFLVKKEKFSKKKKDSKKSRDTVAESDEENEKARLSLIAMDNEDIVSSCKKSNENALPVEVERNDNFKVFKCCCFFCQILIFVFILV